MASYSVNTAGMAWAQRLIDTGQYVLNSDWGEVQPRAREQNAFLESHSWEEYARWHLGLTDGAAARGKAIDMTWPNGAIVPAFVRIDHVLTGAKLAVTDIATGAGFGSDHRYMTATVAIRT